MTRPILSTSVRLLLLLCGKLGWREPASPVTVGSTMAMLDIILLRGEENLWWLTRGREPGLGERPARGAG